MDFRLITASKSTNKNKKHISSITIWQTAFIVQRKHSSEKDITQIHKSKMSAWFIKQNIATYTQRAYFSYI